MSTLSPIRALTSPMEKTCAVVVIQIRYADARRPEQIRGHLRRRQRVAHTPVRSKLRAHGSVRHSLISFVTADTATLKLKKAVITEPKPHARPGTSTSLVRGGGVRLGVPDRTRKSLRSDCVTGARRRSSPNESSCGLFSLRMLRQPPRCPRRGAFARSFPWLPLGASRRRCGTTGQWAPQRGQRRRR